MSEEQQPAAQPALPPRKCLMCQNPFEREKATDWVCKKCSGKRGSKYGRRAGSGTGRRGTENIHCSRKYGGG